jgi:hypothetical protein
MIGDWGLGLGLGVAFSRSNQTHHTAGAPGGDGKISLLVLCAQKREKKEKKNLRSAKRVAFNINITREG